MTVIYQPSLSFMQPSPNSRKAVLTGERCHTLEDRFDACFVSVLASKEKQIQQSYRPVIGIHKWFARRPGTVFRNLLLAEFNCEESLHKDYWSAHEFQGVIVDPFMGGNARFRSQPPGIQCRRRGHQPNGVLDCLPIARATRLGGLSTCRGSGNT